MSHLWYHSPSTSSTWFILHGFSLQSLISFLKESKCDPYVFDSKMRDTIFHFKNIKSKFHRIVPHSLRQEYHWSRRAAGIGSLRHRIPYIGSKGTTEPILTLTGSKQLVHGQKKEIVC